MYPDPGRRRRIGWVDALVIGALVTALWWGAGGIQAVLVYQWDWRFLPQVLWVRDTLSGAWRPNLLLEGLLTTLRLSLWAMLLATTLGLMLGLLATRVRTLPRLVATGFVGLVRNVPPLVFIFVFYYFISSQLMPWLGVDVWVRNMGAVEKAMVNALLGPPELLENLVSGVLCLALLEAAYIAEIVRAGIQSVPEEQHEAAGSLGLGAWQIVRLVVLPQALRATLPPLANQFIMLVKNSAIVSLISVQELTFIASEVAVSTGHRFETWLVAAAMYFVLCFALARLFARMERRSRERLANV